MGSCGPVVIIALVVSLQVCVASILTPQNSAGTKWQDIQENGLEKREVVKTWKKGPPPGWWYHTNGHPEGKRFVPMSPETARNERFHSDSLVDDFMMFLRLKDSGLLDICLGKQ